jgi:hypothetical protein
MKKTSVIIILISLYSVLTSSFTAQYFWEKSKQRTEIVIGDLVYNNQLTTNKLSSFKLPIHVISNRPYDLQAFYTSDEVEYRKSVNFNGEIASFETKFLNEGAHKLSLHLIVDQKVYKYTFDLYVKDDSPVVSFNYYNDKNTLYIDASSTSSVSNFESFIFSFNGEMLTSKTPYASFPLPKSYGFYEVNVSVLNESQKMTSHSKSFTRSFIPIDINVNLDDKKSISLILNEQAHFNLDFPTPKNPERLVRNVPVSQRDQKITFQDTLQKLIDKNSSLDLTETDLSDSVTVRVQLSSFNLQDKEFINLYLKEDLYLPSSDIVISELSRLKVQTIQIRSNLYLFKPIEIHSISDGTIHTVAGKVLLNDENFVNKEELGDRTLDLTAYLNVKQ